MSSKCTITFDNNPFGVYYAGQPISGTAELITTRPKTIRSIYISVSGFAEVRWTENVMKQDSHGKSEKTIETFSSSEMYYNSEKYVYGQSGGSQIELPAGKYAFPFQATIAPNAPTSFNGANGQIQHEVSLVIDRVMRYNNIFKQPFTVLSPYDLNLNPENAKPLSKIEEKTFCWGLCCGNKGPMIMKVNVPFSAYAPGQKIRFHIVLDNQSDVHCSDVKVRLMKRVDYISRSPQTKTQFNEIKVADNHCGEVVKLNKAEFNEFLQIPSTTPSSLASCSIIKISYTLRFIAKVSRIYGDLIIDFPLTIGTVPLYGSSMEPATQPITAQPGAGPVYKPFPPPTFEEDVRSEQFERNTFKPRYPVYLADANTNNVNDNLPGPVSPPVKNPSNIYPKTPEITPMPQPQPQHPSQPYPQPSAAVVDPTLERILQQIIPDEPPKSPSAPQHPSAPPSSTNANNSKAPQPLKEPSQGPGFRIPPNGESTGRVGWK